MAEHAIQIDNQLYERRMEKKGKGGMMPYGTRRGSTRPKKEHDPYGPMPMELDATKKTWSKRKQEQRKKGLCFTCNKPGHQAKNCQRKKGKEQRQLRATQGNKDGQEERRRYNTSGPPKIRATNRIAVDDLVNGTEGDEEVLEERIFGLETTNDTIAEYERHRLMTWEECEERIQEEKNRGTLPSDCEWHWQQKIMEIRERTHPRHLEYPMYACDCEYHRAAQDDDREYMETDETHPYHGLTICRVEGCERCKSDSESEREEYSEKDN